jgi:hypothetical protein
MKSQSVRYRGTKVGRKQKQVITANVDLKHLVDGLKEAQDGEWYDGEDSRLLKQIKLAKALDKSDRVQDAHAAYVPPAGAPVIQRESPVVHDAVLPPVCKFGTQNALYENFVSGRQLLTTSSGLTSSALISPRLPRFRAMPSLFRHPSCARGCAHRCRTRCV